MPGIPLTVYKILWLCAFVCAHVAMTRGVFVALIITFAVPVDVTVNVSDVFNDEGFPGEVPPEPAPVTLNIPDAALLAPFTHVTFPVFDGGVLYTLILVAADGAKVVFEIDILLIVGAIAPVVKFPKSVAKVFSVSVFFHRSFITAVNVTVYSVDGCNSALETTTVLVPGDIV